MNKIITIAILIILSHQSFSQISKAARIEKIDSLIAGISQVSLTRHQPITNSNLMQQQTAKAKVYLTRKDLNASAIDTNMIRGQNEQQVTVKATTDNLVDTLINIIGIERSSTPRDTIEFLLDKIRFYETMLKLYDRYRINIKNEKAMRVSDRAVYLKKMNENLELIKYQYEFLLSQEYTLFKNTNISNQVLKGINIYHDNDFLLVQPLGKLMNRDNDYTGGIRIELTTDQLKMRFLSDIFEDSKFLNNSKVLSYQSLFFGVEAYTPYIRFGEEEAALRDSVYSVGRPFASFQYLGRSKYRLHYSGKWRARNDTRIGWVGKSLAQKGQDILHRDITIASVHVEKWDDQIASGGRLAVNFDLMLDLMLYSVDGDIFRPNRQYTKANYVEHKNRSFHLYAPVEAHAGNVYTGFAAGLGVSNMSFKDRSGGYDFFIPASRRKSIDCKDGDSPCQFSKWWQKSLFYSFEIKGKHVVHNSMLQGLGWIRTTENDEDGIKDEFESKRKLVKYQYRDGDTQADNFNPKNGQIKKWVLDVNFTAAIKQKKTTIFFMLSFNSPEYQYEDKFVQNIVNFANSKSTISGKENFTWNQARTENIENKKYAQNLITNKLLNPKIRGYGRVGLNFLL